MKRIKIAVGAALIVALALFGVFMASRNTDKSANAARDGAPASASPTSEASESASPTPVPPPTPASTSTPGGIEEDGEEFVVPFVAAESASRSDPSRPVVYADVATGTALKDLEAQALEFMENGLVQVGLPEIVSATILDVDEDADPAEMQILACLDYSDVEVVDANGDSAKSDDAPQRIPTLLTLLKEDEHWLVGYRSFPDDASC